MTRDDIIRMAREAGFEYSGSELSWESVICTEELERFAALVASAEREACAEIAMTLTRRMEATKKAHHNHSAEPFIAERFGFERGIILEGQKIADAIRARGQA